MKVKTMIPIYKLREVIRLLLTSKGLSKSYIGKLSGCPRQTVSDIYRKLIASDIDTLSFANMDDDELKRKIYPSLIKKKRLKVEPNYKEIIDECLKAHKKFRKTIWTKYCEYKQMYKLNSYGRSRFYQLISEYLKSNRLSMLQMFAPGEVMFIDYAGATLSYKDKGNDVVTYVFVATLGYSKKRFAYSTKNMTSCSWIEATIAAMEFFGGVPEVIHCDNAKAMIKKPGLVATLGKDSSELAQYYNVLIDTSQVASPTHNPLVENRVKEITHSVLATMNKDLTFFSLREINDYLNLHVEKLNKRVIQRIGLSANDLFFADESSRLEPLPKQRMELTSYRTVLKVPENYFINYAGNRYSVPYEFRNQHVELRVKGEQLYIYHKGLLRVIHDIVSGKNNVVSIDKHLHPRHLAQKSKTKGHYLSWAKGLGIDVERVIEYFYKKTKHEHSRPAGKRCQALQKLEKKYGDEPFIRACKYAVNSNMISATEIELILKSQVYEELEENVGPSHVNVRGQSYYTGG